jgi:LacI family transcriptional regulator
VAFVGDDPSIYTMRERFAGYLRAVQEAGLAVDPDLVRMDAHDAEQATATVADLLTSTSADAVFAANNRAAVGSLTAFARSRRRVALIGFDDFEGASLVQPAVSVVAQPIVEMGQRAAQILIDRLCGDNSPHTTQVLPTTLLVRGSEQQTQQAQQP